MAIVRGERGQEKRGVAAAPQTYSAPASIAYSKVQQPIPKAAPQQYYQPQTFALPQYSQYQSQVQPQPQQQIAYAAQPVAKVLHFQSLSSDLN